MEWLLVKLCKINIILFLNFRSDDNCLFLGYDGKYGFGTGFSPICCYRNCSRLLTFLGILKIIGILFKFIGVFVLKLRFLLITYIQGCLMGGKFVKMI
jgi:hypothetical protein